MDNTTVNYVSSVTKYDIMSHVYKDLYKNSWKTTFNYLKFKPKKFFDKPLELPQGSRGEFKKFVDYCYLLSTNFDEKYEAARYKNKNGIAIYYSTVLYWLLVTFGVISERKLKFCQGYFNYEKNPGKASGARYRAGMHAWLCTKGSVIDTTIWQQQDCFDFQARGLDLPIIAGNIPSGLNYYGFEEHRSLVKEYARRFAKESGSTFYKWIQYHKEQADLVYNLCKLGRAI